MDSLSGAVRRSLLEICLTVVSVSLFAPTAQAQDSPRRYSLLTTEPFVHSYQPFEIVRGGIVPYDRPYENLSDEQKANLRAMYVDMSPQDEPPFPRKGMRRIYESISSLAQKRQATGKLFLIVTVDAHGVGRSVSVVEASEPEFTKAVASVLMLEEYKPAVCHGRPCQMDYPFEMQFTAR